MPVKQRKAGKLANSISDAALGNAVEEQLDEQFDDDTKAKVAGYPEAEDEYNVSEDDSDDWKLDFETGFSPSDPSQRSSLRTENAPELSSLKSDERYKGKKVSRKKAANLETTDESEQAAAELGHLLEGGSEEEDELEISREEEENVEEKGFTLGNENVIDYAAFGGGTSEEDVDSSSDDKSDNDGDEKLDVDKGKLEYDLHPENQSAVTIVEEKDNLEYRKGLAIKSQMIVWDRLLECRIQLQKVLQSVNKFPQCDNWSILTNELVCNSNDEDIKKKDENNVIKYCQSSLTKALNLLLETRSKLLESNPETKEALFSDEDDKEENDEPCRKRRKLSHFDSLLQAYHAKSIPFRNETIERWNDRTRLAAGNSLLSSGGKQNSSSFGAFELSTLKQIQHILADTPRLVRRTQFKRTSYKVLGQKETIDKEENDEDSNSENEESNLRKSKFKEEYDCEIFDDDDFYHNLLRELIERKSGTSESQQDNWLQIQKLRAKANRKKVDTRASKGRKIRYDIHAKLVNFMAPVLNSTPGQISEEAKNELFSSLFK